MGEENKVWSKLIAAGIGLVFVLWFAVRSAPYMEGGLATLLSAMDAIFSHPFEVRFCNLTLQAIAWCVFIYGVAMAVFLLDDRHYRRGEEHGSAKWESVRRLNKKLSNKKDPDQNRILTQNLSITSNQRILRKNLFTLVVGGSGAGKTQCYALPNIMQCNSSYVITDPKGELIRTLGGMLKKNGYKVRVLDLIEMQNSYRYNPFAYFRDDNDVQKFVTNLFLNTSDRRSQKGDQFWMDTAKMMLSAIMYYVMYEVDDADKNMGTVMELIRAEEVADTESGQKPEEVLSPLKMLFDDLREENPNHIALLYFDEYRKGAGKTIKSIQITLLSRLEKFNLESVETLMRGDEMNLESVGEKKTAIFIKMSDNDKSFNFIASLLLTQLFQILMYTADHKYADQGGALPVPVHFLLDEFANITLPDVFQTWQATMRSRGITLSILLQNITQLKNVFPDDWESVAGLCDEVVYLGGNEQNSHEWIGKFLGSETIDTDSFGFSRGRNGSSSKNTSITGRKLLDESEIRLKDKLVNDPQGAAIVIIANEYPVIDKKYDPTTHPRVKQTARGGAPIYTYYQPLPEDKVRHLHINESAITEDQITKKVVVDMNAKM